MHFRPWKLSGLSSYDHYGNSYAANQRIAGWYGASYSLIVSLSLYLQPLSRVPNPGNTLYYWENAGYFAWWMDPDEYPIWLGGEPFVNLESAPVGGWHGQRSQFTVAYADGHAASTHIEGHMDPPPHLDYYPYPPHVRWEGGDYAFFASHVIRGENWQVDILPAAPARTDISAYDWFRDMMEHPIE